MGALLVNISHTESRDRYIHVENFRYGKKPNIIRCNRGDRLHLTFKTLDTGHSFFLEEFRIDAKVSPGMAEVKVFDTKEPLEKPFITDTLLIIAEHPGILKYLISKSQYRCHVWCGPLHAFEQGSLIILPNTLLGFGIGCLTGILILLFIPGFVIGKTKNTSDYTFQPEYISSWNRFFKSPVTKLFASLFGLLFIYIIIIISIFGTQMAGRNLGTIAVWIIWLSLLIIFITPIFGRLWCYVCPIPFFGDLIQRGSIGLVIKGKTGRYNNRFFGFNLKWPSQIDNSWLMLFSFLLLGTFSTTIVSIPRVSGFVILALVILATILAIVFELRAFCRYICPINAFIGQYARIGILSLRAKNTNFCAGKCKGKFCELGNDKGWACPYGLNCETIKDNSKCGLCMECLSSCVYSNTSLRFKAFGISPANLTISESFLSISLFVIAIVYSIMYHGPWSELREYINIIDKNNHELFFIYSTTLWILTLVAFPAFIYFIAWITRKVCKISLVNTIQIFKNIANAITPLGLSIWVAFAIPLLLINFTFILQSVSDPFGWGWNWFGFAGLPWNQIIPQAIPWIQVLLIITGILFSLRNLCINIEEKISRETAIQALKIIGPSFILIGMGMILFYSHF